MTLRELVERVPERGATRGSLVRATIWFGVWLAAVCVDLQVVGGTATLAGFGRNFVFERGAMGATFLIAGLRFVPLVTACAALFGLARWGLALGILVYLSFLGYLWVGLAIWSGT